MSLDQTYISFIVSFKLYRQDKHSINKSHDNCDALPSKCKSVTGTKWEGLALPTLEDTTTNNQTKLEKDGQFRMRTI